MCKIQTFSLMNVTEKEGALQKESGSQQQFFDVDLA